MRAALGIKLIVIHMYAILPRRIMQASLSAAPSWALGSSLLAKQRVKKKRNHSPESTTPRHAARSTTTETRIH